MTAHRLPHGRCFVAWGEPAWIEGTHRHGGTRPFTSARSNHDRRPDPRQFFNQTQRLWNGQASPRHHGHSGPAWAELDDVWPFQGDFLECPPSGKSQIIIKINQERSGDRSGETNRGEHGEHRLIGTDSKQSPSPLPNHVSNLRTRQSRYKTLRESN